VETVGLSLVLVSPRIGVSTAETYGRVTPAMFTAGEHSRALQAALRSHRPARIADHLYNGLEAAVGPAARQVVRIKAALLAAGALGAAMSGSGPTVFGIARSWEHARQIRTRLARVSWACWAVRALRGSAVRLQAR
jgi:4-diphosphocytidyl-2-C-methyl-D-erythritol kinase